MGFIIAAFKPASPPKVPTPDAVWEGLVASGADFSWCVPSFIEVRGIAPGVGFPYLIVNATGMGTRPRESSSDEEDARRGVFLPLGPSSDL